MGVLARSGSAFVAGLILARLLGPKPFGELAAVALVFGLANQVADAGFSSAIVQAPELTKPDVRFAFTIQVLIAALMTTGSFLAAPYLALFFHDPVIQGVVRAISPLFLLQALGQTSTGLLKRTMAFRAIQTAQVSSSLLGYIFVGIPAAWLGAGVWSLVIAQLTQSVSYSVQVYARVRHSIVPSLNPSGALLLRFGSKVTANNVVNWSIAYLDNAVVGHAFGSTTLGMYSRVFDLASIPAAGITGTCQQVLFAGCCRAGNRLDSIRRAYLAGLSAISLLILPVFWSMAACALTVVPAFYGSRWSASASLFRPFALAITLNALMSLSGPILAATDHVGRDLRAQALALLVAAAAFAVAVQYSPAALAWAVLGAYGFRFYIATVPTLRLLTITWQDVFRVTRGPLMVATIVASAAFTTDHFATWLTVAAPIRLALLAFTGAATLSVLLRIAASRILPIELVGFLRQMSSHFHPKLSQALAHVAAQQARRAEQHAPQWTPRPVQDLSTNFFVATLMSQVGETGVQTHFNALCQYLDDQKIVFEVLTPYEAPKLLRGTAKVLRRLAGLLGCDLAIYVGQRLNQALLQYCMWRRLPRGTPWIVYAQCPGSSLAALKCRTHESQRVTMIVHFNLSQADEMVGKGLIRRDGWAYRKTQSDEKCALLGVDRIVYCSEFMRSHLISVFQDLQRKASAVVPNFVAFPRPLSDGPTGDIITIGTLERRKNQGFLLHVLAEANRRGKRYSLTVVGRGELESALKRLAVELKIEGQVTFAGYFPKAAGLLHSHRVYAHAATVENLPIALIEALSVGLPVLAPAVGGIPEIITNGIEGYLWDTNDPVASAQLLIGVLENTHLLDAMSAAAQRKYSSHFRAEQVAPRLYKFLLGSLPILDGPLQ